MLVKLKDLRISRWSVSKTLTLQQNAKHPESRASIQAEGTGQPARHWPQAGVFAQVAEGVNLFRKMSPGSRPLPIMPGMSFKLSLVSLVYPNAETDSEFKPDLLRKANAWLQRRHASISDDLLLIGVGFMDEPAFRAMLKPYGLAGSEIAVIPPDEVDESDGTRVG
jgi:hypothetical protein